jgi:predicted ATPase
VCPECLALLEEAVELYQDDFMAGFTLRDSPDFDEWQFFQREGLRDALAGALERLVHCFSSQGQYERAIGYARRWLALDPLHEPVQRHLMQLYDQAGQRSAALRQYEECVRLLETELGLPPAAATTALYEQIRTRTEEHDAPLTSAELPASATRPQHNLPPQPTSFVGREAELSELDKLIADPDVRLITIVGPGGIGKTRLVLAAAERQLNQPTDPRVSESTISRSIPFPHGAFFVPLALLNTSDDITVALAEALNIQLQSATNRTPNQQVSDYLHNRRLLLILDNFEHLLEGTTLVSNLLVMAPEIQVLVTSRERLHLQQEHVFAIRGLEYPDEASPAKEETYAATSLFRLSAQRVNRNFALEADDVASLTHICRLVDGMPLAIELAASWADVMSLADIATEIQSGLDFLARRWKDVPQRHRSMRAAIDSSWRQLAPDEQEAFSQLCVFLGGFTRDAARRVTSSSIHALTRLASKTLLHYDSAQDRYQIHRLLRQYATEKLAVDAAKEIAARDRHSAYFGAAVQRWEADLKGARQAAAWTEFGAELSNIRASWEWAGTQRQLDRLSQMLDGLCLFYTRPFRPRQGQALCQSMIAWLEPPDSTTRVSAASGGPADGLRLLAKALAWEAYFDGQAGVAADPRLQRSLDLLNSPALADQDTRSEEALVLKLTGYHDPYTMRETAEFEENRRVLGQSLSLSQQLGDHWQQAHTLALLATVYAALGQSENAKGTYAESLILFRRLGDEWMVAETLRLSGRLAWSNGDYNKADGMLIESLELSQRHNNQMDSISALGDLSVLARDRGDNVSAVDYAQRSVRSGRETGDRYGLTVALGLLADAYSQLGAFEQAHQTFEESSVITAEMGPSRALVVQGVRHVRVKLYGGRFKAARSATTTLWELARDLSERYWLGQMHLLSGLLALVEGKPDLARESLLESVADQKRCADQLRLPYSLSVLGLASIRSGNCTQSRQHVFEALETEMGVSSSLPLQSFTFAVIAGVLAAIGVPHLNERAIELYALASSQPLVAKSPFFEEVVGRHISRSAASLPQDAVIAAEERGRALDWGETAEELLAELRELGWASSGGAGAV